MQRVNLKHNSLKPPPLHHLHIRQPELPALEPIRELLVLEAEEVEDGGVEVVDGDGVLRDVPGEVVALAMD